MLYLLVLFFPTSNIIQAFATISLWVPTLSLTWSIKSYVHALTAHVSGAVNQIIQLPGNYLTIYHHTAFQQGTKLLTHFLHDNTNFLKKFFYLLYRMKSADLSQIQAAETEFITITTSHQDDTKQFPTQKWNMQHHSSLNVAHISALNTRNKKYTQSSVIYESHLQF